MYSSPGNLLLGLWQPVAFSQVSYYWVSDSHWLSPYPRVWVARYHMDPSQQSEKEGSQPLIFDLCGYLSTNTGLGILNAEQPQDSSSLCTDFPNTCCAVLPLQTSRDLTQTCPYFPLTSNPAKFPPHPHMKSQTWPNRQNPSQSGFYNSLPSPYISPKWVWGSGHKDKVNIENDKVTFGTLPWFGLPALLLLPPITSLCLLSAM